MADARLTRLSRWRALLRLLWAAGRWRVAGFALLVLLVGLLPTAVILETGALVAAIPRAVADASPAGARPALLALAALAGCGALLSFAASAMMQLGRALDSAFALEVHARVARFTLETPGLAPLEDPALADELQAVTDADQRGALRQTAVSLANVATTRLRGLGAFAVVAAFHGWAALLLAAAWHLTNVVYVRATENGISVNLSDGAVRMRRAEYLRSLALDAPGAKEVRIFGLGPWLVDRYGEAWLDALGALWRSRRVAPALTAATVLALAVSHAAVMGALGVGAYHGAVSAAALLVFVQAVIATSDLGMIGDYQYLLAQSMAVAERVDHLARSVPAAAGGRTALPAAGERGALPSPSAGGASATQPRRAMSVRLAGVRFAYPGRERPTLDGLELEIPAGQSLAVVGENGAGKSTLIKLLCGLYEPGRGSVTFDGGVTAGEARGRMGVIFQDFVRYPLALRENVAFGHLPLLGDERVLAEALADAGGAGLLSTLPHGWDTVLSREYEGGEDLSGGQWQRVALARALAAVRGGAGLLILDEPTASLDVRAEAELFERFLRVTRGVTTILVSHRLSSVRRADRIVVIDGGRVAEDGSHDQLVRAGGRYAEMFALQAQRFTVPLAEAREGARA